MRTAPKNIDVKVDIQTGAFKVYLLKTVVEKVEDPKMQIELKAAQRIKSDAQLGDIVPLEESAAALGRIGGGADRKAGHPAIVARG